MLGNDTYEEALGRAFAQVVYFQLHQVVPDSTTLTEFMEDETVGAAVKVYIISEAMHKSQNAGEDFKQFHDRHIDEIIEGLDN